MDVPAASTPRPTPKAIYDDPQSCLWFIAANSGLRCEGQQFDRKEALRPANGDKPYGKQDVKRSSRPPGCCLACHAR